MYLMHCALVPLPGRGLHSDGVNRRFDLACKNYVMGSWTSYGASLALLTLVDPRRILLYSLDPRNPGKFIVQLY